MKKLYFFFSLILIAQSAISQNEKYFAGIGTGIGIYGGSTNEKGELDTTAVDAACALISASFEYTFAEKFSGGLLVERNGFFTNPDSSEKVSSYNVYAIEKYRFVDNENNKIYAGLMEGYCMLSFSDGNGYAYGSGYSLQAGAGWEHYFTTNFGMSLSAWYAWYQFNKITDSNNKTMRVNNDSEDFVMTLSGASIKAGLVFKF